ncbi:MULTISPECIES: peptidoglycan recognition protein family protein [Bacillus cereus group]|uniref:peptidoglycan recognition protein family protein n=1 Tax=Bacillus cereus group TaxID=86661 RepID=UPI0015CF1E72|nr:MULTISPECIES: peptidoglycan recognition family protein [Bacillus cereus group]MCC2327361.1 peptidoglycan recognition protein family protein [Bacillus wiedmannii]
MPNIDERLLPVGTNRPGTPLQAEGLIIHSTATPGASAEDEAQYFSTGNRRASAHYFVDWDSIVRTIPESEVAWHAGPQANGRFLSIEMCEPKRNTPEADEEFAHVWGATVDLAADICRRYGWSTDVIHSHKWVTETLGGTDHKDPDSYLAEYNRTWDELVADIAGVLSM